MQRYVRIQRVKGFARRVQGPDLSEEWRTKWKRTWNIKWKLHGGFTGIAIEGHPKRLGLGVFGVYYDSPALPSPQMYK